MVSQGKGSCDLDIAQLGCCTHNVLLRLSRTCRIGRVVSEECELSNVTRKRCIDVHGSEIWSGVREEWQKSKPCTGYSGMYLK